jgi:hypothetical protein
MEGLQLWSIYPPSEDVMVGDVFLSVPGERDTLDAVRITSAPANLVAEQFCWQEEARFSLDTIQRSAVKDDKGNETQPAVNAGESGRSIGCERTARAGNRTASRQEERRIQSLRQIAPFNAEPKAHHVTRLREAAIPNLVVGRFTQGDIGGGATSGNFGFNLNAGFRDQEAVRIDLQDLQTAILEENRARRLLEVVALQRWWQVNRKNSSTAEDFPDSLTPVRLAQSLALADNRNGTRNLEHFCRGDFARLERANTRILVANYVFYAGSVTFNFQSREVVALRAALDFASVLANKSQPTTVPNLPGTGPVTPESGAEAANKEQSALDKELARTLALTNNLLSLPGGLGQAQARLTTGSFGGLALERSFRRPAAVGMGAPLQFPIQHAALPVHESQIVDAIAYCATRGFVSFDEKNELRPNGGGRLRDVLQANLGYVKYLVDRNFADGPTGSRVPTLQDLPRLVGQPTNIFEPSARPSQRIGRVRL